MFHLIELIDPADPRMLDFGQHGSYRHGSVVEDESGIRWYLTAPTDTLHPYQWGRAAASGVAAILCEDLRAMSVEDFMEHRVEAPGRYEIPADRWLQFDHVPGYMELLTAGEGGAPKRQGSFVNLHCHTEYSALDGLSTCTEIVQIVQEQGGAYAACADHGNVAAHPDLQHACDKAGIAPVFGLEAYLVDDRFLRREHFTDPQPPASDKAGREAWTAKRDAFTAKVRDYWHITLFATDQQSLHNLWAMSSESYETGMFGNNARLDWDVLERNAEGVICCTGCLRGPLLHKGILDGDHEAALSRLARLEKIFGDRLYVEIHANTLPAQVTGNKALVQIARDHKLPLVAMVDSHYPRKDDYDAHRTWLSVQINKDLDNSDSDLFGGHQDYHMMDEREVREALSYLPTEVVDEAIRNTVTIAAQSTAVVRGTPEPPVFSKGGKTEDDNRLLDMCLASWSRVQGKSNPEQVYVERFEREFDLLRRKGFSGYFLMTSDMTNYAKRNGILVGPGRGSGGGSLVAYLCGITDIDPVEADLLFERFMTEGRTELPDFDVDYPASKKQVMQQYVRDRYGADHVTVVGSVIRLKSKGIIDRLGKAMASSLPEDFYVDQKAIGQIIDDMEADTAGLGMSWSDMMRKGEADLAPYVAKYPHLFQMAGRLVGRVSTFGQHAAGMVISTTGALGGQLPLRRAREDGHMIAQFDKDVLAELGFIKFDLLTLTNLDRIQETIDLVRETRGHAVDVYGWRDEYADPQVWDEIAEAHTLGIFQIETHLGTQYASRMRPQSLTDLTDLVTIVRPGPRNSGLTESYLKRRHGEEPVSYPDPRMEETLRSHYGAMLYQEDIMATCMILGGYDSNEADKVRKILGKKKVEQVGPAGQEFVARATQRGMAQADAAALWEQMAEFSKYSFGKAHAYAYAVLAYWGAWLKFHYPKESLAVALSVVDKDKTAAFVKEARRMGYRVLAPDINLSGSGFRLVSDTLDIRYGLDAVKGIGTPVAQAIAAGQPYASYEEFLARMVQPKGSTVNMGHVRLLARVGAFDSLVPNRRGLEGVLLADKTGASARCIFALDYVPAGAPNGLKCSFDWASEPPPINPRTGKKGKPKPPPKKCTKACRHYTPPPPPQVDDFEPYTDADIRDIEMEMLGLYLSSTPFDALPEDIRSVTGPQSELLSKPGASPGGYLIAGLITSRRPYTDRGGNPMGFLEVETEQGYSIRVTSFKDSWREYGSRIKVGGLYLLDLQHNSRGTNLVALEHLK